ncbi:phage baseplate upper protein [Staphylococcus xylosus]|uniref:BppU family phage baseplate upper protein n=1 Tax=Staphylococcus xylosus TaxID=1288 RepID=UPI002DB78A15|nr:BppU family phage baseplate upper protein [Staphylococcus xylosus]MEB7383802.1 phage baseplate upper protein [Staphylococcus xylosus]
MSMDKITNVKLETTANYQSLSKLGVSFWNQDTNTAILQFHITRNNYPLSLSQENVKVFIALESGDSFLVDDSLNYVDELNGVVAYTIPTDFMRVAKNVVGQVYVTTLDQEETVVQRKFTFDVSNDLIASLPAEDKIREIKYFADMRAEVAEMMTKLNNDFENMNDYVSQVNQTTEDGIAALSTLIQQKQDAYNDNHTAKMKELNDKGSEYSAKFDDDKVYMDDRFQAFQESVNGSGLITTGQTGNWQKYKLTDDDGNYPNVSLNNDLSKLQALPPGFYYGLGTPITISGVSTSGFIEVSVKPPGTVKHIVYRPYNVNKEFVMRYYNEWSGWENKMDGLEKTIDAQSKANTAENNAKQYTDEKYSKRNKILFEGTASGVGTAINLDEDLDNFIMLYIIGDFPGGEFSALGNPIGTRNININTDNVVGLDATDATSYECTLKKISRQKLEINSDNYVNILTGEGSGANANKFTIQKIIGVYK